MMNEDIILVDESDNEIGYLDKLSVHQTGALHRAFSVFIFNSKEELMIQQRADEKYHSAGLWSNTCCSHPRRGEKTSEAVKRRLKEEMGIQCDTDFKFSFIYKVQFDNGLTEHELDHVYFGNSDMPPILCHSEAKDWRYISLQSLENEISLTPEKYTAWLKICLPEVKAEIAKAFKS